MAVEKGGVNGSHVSLNIFLLQSLTVIPGAVKRKLATYARVESHVCQLSEAFVAFAVRPVLPSSELGSYYRIYRCL